MFDITVTMNWIVVKSYKYKSYSVGIIWQIIWDTNYVIFRQIDQQIGLIGVLNDDRALDERSSLLNNGKRGDQCFNCRGRSCNLMELKFKLTRDGYLWSSVNISKNDLERTESCESSRNTIFLYMHVKFDLRYFWNPSPYDIVSSDEDALF